MTPRLDPTELADIGARLAENISRAVKAPDRVVRDLIVALLADGHVLIEDAPGVGKTALARALARSLEADYARVQCTSDLLPADLVGTNVFNQRESRFEFHPGPVFANVVLVDEINRASPKTQSGLLECMQERQITIDGTKHELARPFVVLATQNPAEYEGTYPLPEAELDRFMVRVTPRLPGQSGAEAAMLAEHADRDPGRGARADRRRHAGARRPGGARRRSRGPRRCAATWSRSATRPGRTRGSSSAPVHAPA